MFTDRKKFLFKHPGAQVRQVWWLLKGKRPEAITVNHPMGVNVYVGITPHGATTSHIITGTSKHTTSYTNKAGVSSKNITSAECQDVHTLLPEGRRLLQREGGGWFLQQDNDPRWPPM
jgi:hypothetical protein